MIAALVFALAAALAPNSAPASTNDAYASSSAEAQAAASLAEVRARFAERSKAESIAALERLAASAPDTDAAGRALLWLGDLLRQAGDHARARRYFDRAYLYKGEIHLLAARGEGDLAFAAHRYLAARAFYDEALSSPISPVMTIELHEKRELTVRAHRRWLLAIAAWSLVGVALAWFLARARLWKKNSERRFPVEAIYVLPVYAILIGGALGRDAGVVHALIVCAVGSTALIAASGLAARRDSGRVARALHAALLIAANLALFYGAVHQAGLVDTLLVTITGAGSVAG